MRAALGLTASLGAALVLAGAAAGTRVAAQAPAEPPAWAYPINTPGIQPPADDGQPKRVPGSAVALTQAEIRNPFAPPDWHPADHPPAPDPVVKGRRPDAMACGYCHYPNGQGRPENAALAGLPLEYIVQQTMEFASGARKSSEPDMGPPKAMARVAKAATEAEVREAAAYFAALAYQPWIRVEEASTVPKTIIAGGVHVPAEGGGTEPIGSRIIEMPQDPARAAVRDTASGFVAYVPTGSIARGENLVTTGGGRTVACGTCHGTDLKGLGPVPPIAGRSPSYLVRQLFDLKSGARDGAWSDLMDEAVRQLTVDDMIAIAAYTASRQP
ncbi:MAG: cytochrome c [Vicinamibacterales bacterium]